MPLRGPLRYSQRSGHLQTRFAQTVQVPSSERCSVAQHVLMAGGYLSARPLRELRPNGLFAALTSRGLGLPHFSRLTSHKGTARRATTTSLLIPTPSLLAQGNHKGCPYALTPTPSLLTPHPSLLTPHPSLLTPTPSLLTPHPSLLTPHSSPLTPHSSPLTPHSYGLTPHPSPLRPHSSSPTANKSSMRHCLWLARARRGVSGLVAIGTLAFSSRGKSLMESE